MIPSALKQHVDDQGVPPDSFLNEIIAWAKTAPLEIFEPNQFSDIYSQIKNVLGPWASVYHRRAVMLEVMRVHAGFESSWKWSEGVDRTNKRSMANKTGRETGIFQVSFDSEHIEHDFLKPFATAHGIDTVDNFIAKMKTDHALAIEYYARLLRVNVRWAGPIIRHEIDPWLRRDAVAEFQRLTAVA
jgi:hypothetical protein